jgi:transposase
MQEKDLELKAKRIASLPIINRFIDQMKLHQELKTAIGNEGYADALLALTRNILVDRAALYAIQEWSEQFDSGLVSQGKIGDDKVGRALDRLFEADRATLQTRIVLSVMKVFKLQMERIHNDTTSITVTGEYANQEPEALQLKRGHSKDHRPDLKQLVYSLCVSSDGAVPIHFKSYDGNQSDDGIHMETWRSIRALLQHPKFVYVADCKLCTESNLRQIDKEHGFFVTVVPRTRTEVTDFTHELISGEVRWERILRKRSTRKASEFDTVECAQGTYQLREGFSLYWYRSSQKKKRDAKDRSDRIARAREKLENLDVNRGRGPKTEAAIRKRVDKVVTRYKVQDWLTVEIKFDEQEVFKATTRGKPTSETKFRRVIKKVPRLHLRVNAEGIARSKVMDGIFPLTTNTKEKPVEVLKIYKYQPKIEKRHAMLKSTLDVAPVWLKKNTRIEALMFVEYLAQMIAALVERELRQNMADKKVVLLQSLPESRPSKTPTIEQILRLFENRSRHELYQGSKLVKEFADPLTPVQSQILKLLSVPETAYLGGV